MKSTMTIIAMIASSICILSPTAVVAQVESSISEPMEWSDIAAAEQGVVAEILVKVGQTVHRGDLLARLDHQDLEQSITLAQMKADSQSGIRAAEATLKLRKSQHENLLSLSQNGHSNPDELANVAAQYELAEAELLAARELQQQNQQEVLRLQALLERRSVRSPLDGIVTELHRRPGEFVSGTEPRLATVVNLDQLRVRFYLLPEQIETLKAGQSLQVTHGQAQVPATVEFILPITDPKTGLSRVDLLISNHQHHPSLRSGTRCVWPQTFTNTSLDRHEHVQAKSKISDPISTSRSTFGR